MSETTAASTTRDPKILDALATRARQEVDAGLLPACQLAVALDGEIIFDETFGADPSTRFIPFSATKVITAAACWRLIGDGALDVSVPVATYLPEFGDNGKEAVTVEQVLTHTGGFPLAPIGPREWRTRASRLETYRGWRLDFAPGSQFVYHPISGHFVLCDVIETLMGEPYVDALHHLVTEPLGLRRLLGIPLEDQAGIAEVAGVGDAASVDDIRSVFGESAAAMAQLLPPEVVLSALTALNHPKAKAAGVPGGGGVVRAADMAMLYQGLLRNSNNLWNADVLADGCGHIRNSLPDSSGIPANRTLGLVVAGSDGHSAMRGFGTRNSPRAFGHNGAGGQIAFADPATGLSVCYVTNGLDQNLVREHRRCVDIADAMCALASV